MYQAGQTVEIIHKGWPGVWAEGSLITLKRPGHAKGWWYADPSDGSHDGLIDESDFRPLTVESPVRTVTRREIVPGHYGCVIVGSVFNVPDCDRPDEPPTRSVDITIDCGMTADELTAAARTLTELAEALRDGS